MYHSEGTATTRKLPEKGVCPCDVTPNWKAKDRQTLTTDGAHVISSPTMFQNHLVTFPIYFQRLTHSLKYTTATKSRLIRHLKLGLPSQVGTDCSLKEGTSSYTWSLRLKSGNTNIPWETVFAQARLMESQRETALHELSYLQLPQFCGSLQNSLSIMQ